MKKGEAFGENSSDIYPWKGGNAVEAERYKKFFPECEVLVFDYKSQTPWEAEKESAEYFDDIVKRYKSTE